MAKLNGLVDWNTVETKSFEVVPEGMYAAKLVSSKDGKTKAGHSKIDFCFELVGTHKFKGRKIYKMALLSHPNTKVVEITHQNLKSMAEAIGRDITDIEDTAEMVGEMFGIKLKVKKSDKYGEQNEISYFTEYSDELLDIDDQTSVDTSFDFSVQDTNIVFEEEKPVEEEEFFDDKPTPEAIKAMKKDELTGFIKASHLKLDMKVKRTIGELKEAIIEELYPTEVNEDDEFIIED